VLAVLEPAVGPECPEEGLLEGILGRLAAEPPAQEAEHDLAVLDVEVLEWGHGRHCFHHPYQTQDRRHL
jgi:hypothetical protein